MKILKVFAKLKLKIARFRKIRRPSILKIAGEINFFYLQCEMGTVSGLKSALLSMGRKDAVQLLERENTCSKVSNSTAVFNF